NTSAQTMRPVIFSSTIGTAIEWYDFFLYGTMAALVFPKVFFPESDAVVGTLLSLFTFLVGFIARPFGGALFGHLGDRIGRKSTLIATLLVMGISSLIIGFLPGYVTIGFAWRIPFFISALLVIIGLYIRLRILETPLFTEVKNQGRQVSAPIIEAFRHSTPEILLSAGARFAEQAPFYLFSVFVITYGVD